MLDCFKDLKPFDEKDADGNPLVDILIKECEKKRKNGFYTLSATASFTGLIVHPDTGKIGFANEDYGACHGSFKAGKFADSKGCRLVLSNFQVKYTRYSKKDFAEADKYIDYLVNRSHFKHAFVHYEPEKYWVVRGDLPCNYVTGALVATRACWEKLKGPIFSFNKLVEAGVDEHTAFVLCFVFYYPEEKALAALTYSGHLPMHCDCMTTFKNYVTGNIDTGIFNPNMNESTYYSNIDNLWGKRNTKDKISDFQNGFLRSEKVNL